ncbi:retrovirus-related pol polyprotein from transposon TNT 1-94 [Tanacetum coccineum]|uniref:Retrovirus-related pol polyprotein from transposon TNT 1-94 n=1 Tax=Tanacetum coccineum TaxID=301880 RepID=A0ABQ5G2N7_9ASTR
MRTIRSTKVFISPCGGVGFCGGDRTSSNPRNQATIQDGRVIVQQVQGRQGQSYAGNSYKGNATSSGGIMQEGRQRWLNVIIVKVKVTWLGNVLSRKGLGMLHGSRKKAMLAEAQEAGQILDEEQLEFFADPCIPDGKAAQTTILNTTAFQTEDLDAYDSDCDDVSNAKAVLMANLSNYGSDVISESFEQTLVVDSTDNEITSDSNIIPYSQYLQETQQAAVQDNNLYAQQDSMILSVIEQISEQMINHVNNWKKANQENNNESLTAELERYKERVKTFEQRLNIDLSTREKMIDSQMDEMIKEKLALKHQTDSLEQNLSNQIKEKKSLFQTFTVFKNESKEKESKYMDKEINLEKKIKELDNIVYKVGQFAQTVHMLTKPQVFYDDTHKQALGYQNPFYLKKAQRIKPTLYDGSVISSQHAACLVIDDEETLILEEVSRSKMLAKQNDLMFKEKKVNTTLINYAELNRLSEDFGKRFFPQQELSDEQAFWLQTSHPNTDQSASLPVKIEAPRELPKVSLVNTSLKKLKYHLGQFDIVMKKHITPDAITEGEWGFEHTKAVFLKEIIPFLKALKYIFNVFDKDLLNENILNDLKAQLQAKDPTICKLKEHIKSMRENDKEDKVKHEMDKIKTINIELEHSVAKVLSENEHLHKEIEHLKKIYKDQFDSIKKTRALSKEHGDSLIAQFNSKSMENADLKRKETVKNAAQIPIATTIAPGMFKIDLEPLAPRLLNNREAHIDYLKHTQEQADILQGIVKQAKAKQPLDNALDFACKHAKRIQELLVYVRDTCPNVYKPSEKLIVVTPMNKVKIVRIEVRVKSKSNKKNRVKDPICDANVKHTMLNVISEKPTGKVFTEVGHKWKPTGRVFTIVGNSCPLTKITPKKIVHLKETTSNSVETPKLEIKVYSRRPKQIKSVGSSNKAKIVESKIANNSEPNHLWGSNATDVPSSSSLVNDRLSRLSSGTVRFRNDQVAKIMRYGDYQPGNENTCFIWNLEGVDLLSGSKDKNLYIISLDDMLKTSSICLLSKASKTKSWLWHCQLSHLNFGKSKKSSHQPKDEDANQEKLYLFHMDLCGPMRVECINGKKYILVIVDNYSRFTWVKFLRSKDEAPEAIIKCIKNIQVRLNATVRNVRTDNGNEFVNQNLYDFYENVGISHPTSIARTSQQNGVVDRQNRTLMEAARTLLIFSKAPLFLWPKQSIQLVIPRIVP